MAKKQGDARPRPFASRAVDRSDQDALREFIDEGVVREVIGVIKSGKEATVYRCVGGPHVGPEHVAVKVYRESGFRDFRNDDRYREGQVILNGQVRRAIEAGTAAGRKFSAAMWVDREFDVLCRLADAGVPVPEPFFATDRAILMALIGSADNPAVQLQHARLMRAEAETAWRVLAEAIERMLDAHVVHADLSPFNVLAAGGDVTIIDFPQAVDPRENRHAVDFLRRDVENLARWFRKEGVEIDVVRLVPDLWRRYTLGLLG